MKTDSLIKIALKESTILSALSKRRAQISKLNDDLFIDILKSKKNKSINKDLITSNLEKVDKARSSVDSLRSGLFNRRLNNKFTKN